MIVFSPGLKAIGQQLCCAVSSFERQPEEFQLPLAPNKLQEATHTTWSCCLVGLGLGVGFFFNWLVACVLFGLAVPSLFIVYHYPVLLRVTEKWVRSERNYQIVCSIRCSPFSIADRAAHEVWGLDSV
jgi:hypothetical protein